MDGNTVLGNCSVKIAKRGVFFIQPEGIKKEYNYNSLFCPNKGKREFLIRTSRQSSIFTFCEGLSTRNRIHISE